MHGVDRTLVVARSGANGKRYFQKFQVPCSSRTTVLDALLHIQKKLDRTLAFRYACRQAMCGTCGVRVNGVERLACYTLLEAVPGRRIVIEPLRHLPVIRDLVVDLTPFFRAWSVVGPSFVSANPERKELACIPTTDPNWQIINQHRECISCALCFSACDIVGIRPGFPGPAALTHALCLILDNRDEARNTRLVSVDQTDRCWACHGFLGCSNVCPKGIDPATAIERLKRMIALRRLR